MISRMYLSASLALATVSLVLVTIDARQSIPMKYAPRQNLQMPNEPSTVGENEKHPIANRNLSIRFIQGIPRGGATKTSVPPSSLEAIQKYKLQQQHLLQLRSTFLSEALASRGIQVGPTLTDVATPEGSKPPQETDWDCSMSTFSNPKTCLYSFDAEPNTKVIAPVGTTQYISLSALNRLRRTDPTKVEPMWHSQYAILKSWFNDSSPYSLLQFVGWKGFIVSTLLLDLGKGMALKALLAMSVFAAIMISLPLIEAIVCRVLTSSTLWMKWMSWGKFVHAALPLKILLGQMAWKFCAGSFGKLEGLVKEYLVDLECAILESSIPVTILEEEKEDDTEDEGFGLMDDSDDAIDEDKNASDEYDTYDEYDSDGDM